MDPLQTQPQTPPSPPSASHRRLFAFIGLGVLLLGILGVGVVAAIQGKLPFSIPFLGGTTRPREVIEMIADLPSARYALHVQSTERPLESGEEMPDLPYTQRWMSTLLFGSLGFVDGSLYGAYSGKAQEKGDFEFSAETTIDNGFDGEAEETTLEGAIKRIGTDTYIQTSYDAFLETLIPQEPGRSSIVAPPQERDLSTYKNQWILFRDGESELTEFVDSYNEWAEMMQLDQFKDIAQVAVDTSFLEARETTTLTTQMQPNSTAQTFRGTVFRINPQHVATFYRAVTDRLSQVYGEDAIWTFDQSTFDDLSSEESQAFYAWMSEHVTLALAHDTTLETIILQLHTESSGSPFPTIQLKETDPPAVTTTTVTFAVSEIGQSHRITPPETFVRYRELVAESAGKTAEELDAAAQFERVSELQQALEQYYDANNAYPATWDVFLAQENIIDANVTDLFTNTPYPYSGTATGYEVKYTFPYSAIPEEQRTLVSAFAVDGVNTATETSLSREAEPVGSADADNDTLSLVEEYDYNTDPNASDTDGDGLTDGDEVKTHYTLAIRKDTDGDGFLDGTEVENGFDPNGEGKYPAKPLPRSYSSSGDAADADLTYQPPDLTYIFDLLAGSLAKEENSMIFF